MCKRKNGIFPCGLWAFSSRLTYYILVVYGKHTKLIAEAGPVSHMAFNYFCAKLITETHIYWSVELFWVLVFFPLLPRLLLIGFIWLTFQAKKAGSQLKSRIVAEKPVAECAQLIEQLEGQISIIIREERLVSCCYALNFCKFHP